MDNGSVVRSTMLKCTREKGVNNVNNESDCKLNYKQIIEMLHSINSIEQCH